MKTNRTLCETEQALLRMTVRESGPAVAADIFQVRLPRLVKTVTGVRYSEDFKFLTCDSLPDLNHEVERVVEKYYDSGLICELPTRVTLPSGEEVFAKNPCLTYQHYEKTFNVLKTKEISELETKISVRNEQKTFRENTITRLSRTTPHSNKELKIHLKEIDLILKEKTRSIAKDDALLNKTDSLKNKVYQEKYFLLLAQYDEESHTVELLYDIWGIYLEEYRYLKQDASIQSERTYFYHLSGRNVEERFLQKAQEQWKIQRSV